MDAYCLDTISLEKLF